jgi:heme/copper-type cytochrome/quinol oxidase subunit 3
MSSADAPLVSPYAELEPPEILARNLQVGARVLAAAQSFALLVFVFAYLYLRALDSNGDWRPKHVDPSAGIGAALAACLVLCAVAYLVGVRSLGDGTERRWRVAASAALAFGVGAFGLIVAQLASISFGPTSGGYASVFIGWHAFYGLNLLLALAWLETLVAQSFHARTRQVAPEAGEVGAPFALMRPAGDALAIVLSVLILFGILGYVLLYVA